MNNRILLVLISDSYGGTEKRFSRYFEYLRDINSNAILFVNSSLLVKLRRSGILSGTERVKIIPEIFGLFTSGQNISNKIVYFLRKVDFLIASSYLTLFVLVKKPKIVHAVLAGVYAALPLLIFKLVKTTITMPSIELSKLTREKIGLFINLIALKLCHRVDVLSPSAVAEILSKGIKIEKVYISKCSFTDTNKFRPTKKKIKVVFAARLESYHRPMLFLESVKHTNDRNAQFCVLGYGTEENELRRYIENALEDFNVSIFFKEDISEELKSALVFVTLKDENYPSQSLLEAMSCGCAIVASKGGDTRLLVKNDFGFIVNLDVNEISEKVKFLLNNPQKAQEMGEKARKFVIDNHTIKNFDVYLRHFWEID